MIKLRINNLHFPSLTQHRTSTVLHPETAQFGLNNFIKSYAFFGLVCVHGFLFRTLPRADIK